MLNIRLVNIIGLSLGSGQFFNNRGGLVDFCASGSKSFCFPPVGGVENLLVPPSGRLSAADLFEL